MAQVALGVDIRQSGPFSSARTAARHWSPSDSARASAKAEVVDAAKAIMQIAEPMIESDFISVDSVYFMRGLPTLGLYSDRYRMQIKSGRCCRNKPAPAITAGTKKGRRRPSA
jgi:hypothetical protein